MPGCLYYFPRATAAAADALVAKHIPHAIDAGDMTVRGVASGPDSHGGIIVAGPNVPEAGYFSERQRWHRALGSHYHVGIYTDQPQPGPDDLARAKQVEGHPVTLADGNDWLAPVAREFHLDASGEPVASVSALPVVSKLNDQGEWTEGDVLPQYAALWRVAEAWWDAKRQVYDEAAAANAEEATISFDFHGGHERAVEALSTNYRLGPLEASVLGLLTLEKAAEVLDALIDYPTMVAWLKKKESSAPGLDGSDSDSGQPAEPPTTDQQ